MEGTESPSFLRHRLEGSECCVEGRQRELSVFSRLRQKRVQSLSATLTEERDRCAQMIKRGRDELRTERPTVGGCCVA